jgi:mannose-6-phosphate isomerase
MMTLPRRIGPLLLTGALHETIWGGRNLTWLAGKTIREGASIGESWETDRDCVVRTGPLAGQTLAQVVADYGERMIGSRAAELFGPRFPLLAKFIDARQQLSVQVHPDDADAQAHEHGTLGKTEVWYILHAEPGAQVVYGLKREASRDEVRAAIAANRLEGLLGTCEVKAGDVIFVPAGTVHAIGAGVALYELQEYSDITYRLYDYGRLQADGKPRQLHVASALRVMHFGPADGHVQPMAVADAPAPAGTHRVLVANRYFVLAELLLGDGSVASATVPASCQIVSVLAGVCTLRAGDEVTHLGLGDTVVLPASLGSYAIDGPGARIVRSFVPAPDDALLARWEAFQASSR